MVHLIGAAPTQKSWGHVKAIAFLGTPFEGADKTQWIRAAEKVSKYFPLGKFNKELPRDLEPGSQALENLSRDFLQWLHNPQQIPEDKFSVVCFYEELDSPFGEIVPHESSKLGGWLTLPIRATHTGMCKYSDEDEASYQRV